MFPLSSIHFRSTPVSVEALRRRDVVKTRFGQQQPGGSLDDLRAAWQNPAIRATMETAILNGNFKAAPHLGRQFIRHIDRISRSSLSNQAQYQALRQQFVALNQRPELKQTFTQDWHERIHRRVLQVAEMLGNKRPDSLLDVGCGDGDITTALKNHFGLPKNRVSGLEVVVRPDERRAFDITRFDGLTMPLPDHSQSLMTLFAVLHHAEQPLRLLQEMHRVLKPGGQVIVRDMDAPTPELKLFNLVMDKLYFHVYTPFQEVPIPGHYKGKEEWVKLCEQAGFRVQKVLSPEPTNPYRPFMLLLTKP